MRLSFVISGYVVSGSLLRERHRSGRAYLLAFYTRRVKRLAPALLATVLATSVGLAIVPSWAPNLDEYYVAGQALRPRLEPRPRSRGPARPSARSQTLHYPC